MYFFRFLGLIIPIAIIGLIVYGIFHLVKRRRHKHPTKDRTWYLRLSFSKEDAVSQWLLLLGFFFFGVTLASFNRDFHELIPWHYIVLITTVVGLIASYYFRLLYVLAFSLIGITGWWCYKAYEWLQPTEVASGVIVTGFVFIILLYYFLARFHEKEIKFKRFSLVYMILSLISLTGILIFMSTRYGLNFLEETVNGNSLFASWEMVASLAIFLAVIVGLIFYLLKKKLISAFEVGFLAIVLVLFLVIALVLPNQEFFNRGGGNYFSYRRATLNSTGILWAVIFNILAFLEFVWIIFLGYFKKQAALINFGAVMLFILIITKYFDWFFTFLDKSLFFIGAGLLLFVVGWSMEKGRRRMLTNIKSEKTVQPTEQ